MVKLAPAKAWYHCMQRMTPAEETYLKAWMQAVRNIGAGTGKRADRFRKVARQTLEKCRSAIPAWIMPIHRLAETVTPGEDQFDVVIVDEASQSGAEALFLHYIAKKIIIVGDDKQIAPYNVGINRDDVELLRHRHIKDLPLSDYFDLEHSFFDQAYLRFGNRIRLCEHFRCMPEIIQFSNKLCYSNEPLLPLRQYGDGRIEPVVVAKHVSGHMEGTSPTVVEQGGGRRDRQDRSPKLVADPLYKDKTFGVISMLGEKQARLIEEKLLKAIGPEEMERRRLICGDAYSFQGDERQRDVHQPGRRRRTRAGGWRRSRSRRTSGGSTSPPAAPATRCGSSTASCPTTSRRSACGGSSSSTASTRRSREDAGEEISTGELEELVGDRRPRPRAAPPPFKSWLEVDVFLQIRTPRLPRPAAARVRGLPHRPGRHRDARAAGRRVRRRRTGAGPSSTTATWSASGSSSAAAGGSGASAAARSTATPRLRSSRCGNCSRSRAFGRRSSPSRPRPAGPPCRGRRRDWRDEADAGAAVHACGRRLEAAVVHVP